VARRPPPRVARTRRRSAASGLRPCGERAPAARRRTRSPGRSPPATASRGPRRTPRGPCHGGAAAEEGRCDERERHTVTSAAAAAGRHRLDAVEHVGKDVLEELVHWAARGRCTCGIELRGTDGDVQGFERRVAGEPLEQVVRRPCSATACATERLCVRMTSCSRWRSPPAFTPRISKRSWRGTAAAPRRGARSPARAPRARGHVGGEHQDRVAGQKRLRKNQSAIGAVVQGTLEPLLRRVCQAFPSSSITKRASPVIRSARMDSACTPSRTIPPGRSRTARASRLHAAAAAHRCELGREAWAPMGHPRQGREHLGIELPRVGLARDREHPGKAHPPGDRASSSRTFSSSPSNSSRKLACVPVVPFTPGTAACPAGAGPPRVEQQLLHPQGDPLADRW